MQNKMGENKNIPQIRFIGFSGTWEERKLDDISDDKYGGGTPKTSVESYWNGSIPWIQSSDLTEDELSNVYPRKFISEAGLRHSATKLVPQNSIAIITRVGVGKLAYMPFSYTTSQDYLSLSKLNIDAWFSVYSIYKKIKGELNAVQGTSIKGITKDELLSKCILIPNNPKEQSKIGTYFQNLDKLITLQQQKHDKLVTLKKAMLDKMFPKEGADVPEIRFMGFTGDWDKEKLGDIGYTYTGLTGKTKADFGHGNGKYITYMNVFSNPVADNDITEAIEVDNNQNKVQFGDVFFTTSSETPEEVGMSSVWLKNCHNTYLNSFCFGYRPNIKVDNYYFAYLLRSTVIRKRIIFLAQGISRYNISKNKVMEISVPLPNLEEQKQIGSYFQNLDKLISLHQQEIQKLKNIKKACLEKMFV